MNPFYPKHFCSIWCILYILKELDYPLILAPPLVVAQSCTALLDIQAFFQDCLLQNLQTFYNNRNMLTIRASLQLLVSLFQDDHWLTSVHRARRDGLAILLYSQPETLAECLTDMLYLRHGTSVPQGFRLQDWELILTLVGKVSDVARYALDTFAPLNGFLKSLENKDWKTRLLWYDLSSHIPELKQPISVPDSLYRLTGEMNGLFVSDQNKGGDDQSKTIGWIHLFDACKLSRTLIDTLFINHEKWMYNLILLWKHPNEDDIIGPCFREILHPKLNFSVSIEYPILLVDFIGRLADTFHIQKTIIDYYIQKDDVLLLKFISKLSEQATKQFFQVLYIIRLLRDEAKEGKELDTENTYYISSLIKTLQGLTNWGMLCKVHYFETQPAYTKMKSILIPVNTSTFDRHPLTLGDNINPGTGTAAEQPSKVIHTFYPLFNEHAISCRALALLTFCLLCEVCGQFESQEARDMVRRQVLQLVEGFVDLESRIYFDKLVKQQPKNRIAKWKKAEHTKIQMSLRPVLSEEEENLVTSHLTSLYDSEKNGILQALDLTESHKEKENSGPKLLYFS
ncbi:hypothetical protein K501DRAFT_313166 [Backusella circina FSU 941]|nr:hypothetical protein K501DRAFT_313166 [Backusella circina FSU 941]